MRPIQPGEQGEITVVPIALGVINQLSQVRLYMPSDLRPLESRLATFKSIDEVMRRFKDEVPLLDPIKDMQIKDRSFLALVDNIKKFEKRLNEHPLTNDPEVASLYEAYHKKVQVLWASVRWVGLEFLKGCSRF